MARPEPINATHAHSKAKLSLFFADSLFVAGEHVSGKMELECKAERGLGIGDIKVELFAIQGAFWLSGKASCIVHGILMELYLCRANVQRPFSDEYVPPFDAAFPRPGFTTFQRGTSAPLTRGRQRPPSRPLPCEKGYNDVLLQVPTPAVLPCHT